MVDGGLQEMSETMRSMPHLVHALWLIRAGDDAATGASSPTGAYGFGTHSELLSGEPSIGVQVYPSQQGGSPASQLSKATPHWSGQTE
jgi:hypothetical protein